MKRDYSNLRNKLHSNLWQNLYIFIQENAFENVACEMVVTLSRPQWNFRYVIFKHFSVIDGWGISCEIALIWMSLDFTDDQSTLVQVMAWCRQTTSHYLSQCWPRSLSPYDVTRPQWVNPHCLCRWSVCQITSSADTSLTLLWYLTCFSTNVHIFFKVLLSRQHHKMAAKSDTISKCV